MQKEITICLLNPSKKVRTVAVISLSFESPQRFQQVFQQGEGPR